MERNVQMNIRVSEEEKALFAEAARRCGLTLSQYIRMKLAGRARGSCHQPSITGCWSSLPCSTNRTTRPRCSENC